MIIAMYTILQLCVKKYFKIGKTSERRLKHTCSFEPVRHNVTATEQPVLHLKQKKQRSFVSVYVWNVCIFYVRLQSCFHNMS